MSGQAGYLRLALGAAALWLAAAAAWGEGLASAEGLAAHAAPPVGVTAEGTRQVRVGGQWLAFEDAVETFAARLELGELDEGDAEILAKLGQLAASPAERYRLAELQVRRDLVAGDFDGASQRIEWFLRGAGDEPAAPPPPRLVALEEILLENADGMYVLTEPWPATGGLVGDSDVLQPGPASLADPSVLSAALHEKACRHIRAGAFELAAGRSVEAAQPEAAAAAYLRGLAEFEAADGIVRGIAQSYQVELARRRIGLIQRGAEPRAARFDAELAALGRQSLGEREYREKILRMVEQLDAVESDLQEILRIAGPYNRQLALEVEWADAVRSDVGAMRETLRVELDAPG